MACDLPSTKQTPTLDVAIAESLPGKLKLSDDPALRFSSEDRGDYICLFVLGWPYILSVRLIELRGKDSDDRVSYTGNLVENCVNGKKSKSTRAAIELNIGTQDYAERLWWTSVLADWQTILTRNGREYRPIWEFHLQDTYFILAHGVGLPRPACQSQPPTSEEAQEYLSNFARLNDIFNQLIIGLASVMTLPSCNRWGNLAKYLPMLMEPTKSCVSGIPHLIALSSFPTYISSGLANSFWEKDIPCNLVSEWLNPVLKDITPLLLQQKDYKAIICAMSERRPTLAPLWMGSAATGTLPRVLIEAKELTRVSPEPIVWTGSSQCFMDPQFFRSVPVQRGPDGKEMIPREDEFPLLYLLDTEREKVFRSPPVVPSPPLDLTSVESCSIMDQTVCDTGISNGGQGVSTHPSVFAISTSFPRTNGLPSDPEFDKSLSQNATSNVFAWPCHTEGTKPEDRALWKHEWLSWFLEDED
ncbi:hypothetical protein N7481_011769 [Penicillium waksmanii]|uniref:uncharacterized protein n=1 Tax=Penicillium waksmanii TaxID=69791 RepID=UPI00254729C7|nr:uncharacterized protein N7481_011769 [Penicillium waksmanii]KAJ5974559.1 hypothetical protein N7481_011769 [Penicillium waksmanii]